MFSPTEHDRERLEELNMAISEAVDEDTYVYHHDADALQLGVRLKDLHPRSELARRMNLDTRFAIIARKVADIIGDPDDAAEVIEAATLIGKMRYGERGEAASKAWIDAHYDMMTPDDADG